MSADHAHHLLTRGLAVGYARTPIVSDVDLEVPPGRITALIGANGSGKSTLLRTMARVLPAAAGSVVLDGRDLRSIGRRPLARILTTLPQHPTAPEGLSVRELCRFGRHPHRSRTGRLGPADEAAVDRALEDAGLVGLADRQLAELSGGQRQRAWIAMTLAQATPVLLLDEPTTFLDIAHQMEVLRLLRRLNRDLGRTVVLVLHDLNQAARFADHVVALARGGIVATGTPAEVITEEVIIDVFGLDCAVVPNPLDGTPLCIPRS